MTAVAAQIIAFPGTGAQWRHAAGQIWPAWRALCRWEETSATELGLPFGELVVLLWALHRFGDSDAGVVVAADLLDDLSGGGWSDPLLADVAECAFALGAGWAESRRTAEH